jgi:capsular exopolysaccharide synthesis family protein
VGFVDRSHQFRLLWASKYWVLLFAVAAGVAAYVVSSLMTDKYRADALGQIVSTRQAQGDVLSEEELLSLSNLYVKLADTNTVLQRAHDEPGVAGKEAEFDSSVSVEPEERVGVLSFIAETDNARESADFANAYATAFADYTEELQARQRDQALERIQDRIDKVSAELDDLGGTPDDPRGVGLRAELAALQERAADETANPGDTARVIERAFPPSSPDSPKPLRNAVLAFIAALVLAAVALYLRETLFDRYGSPEEAASDLGLPVLGEIPKASDRALALESFRSLRTAALLALERSAAASGGNGAREDGGGELLITGPEPGCGKSYVTANLARALAAEGRTVVAVDADMRRPTLHEQFGVASQPGLGDLLVGDGLAGYTGQLAAPVQAVPGSITADGELRVLTAGPHIENSVERLSSDRMEEIVERLRAQSDVVVFDSPPTLAVVDPVVLARYVDGVIVVIDSRKTKRRDARRSVQELRAIGAPVLGFVFNRVRGRRAGYYSYQPQREPRGRRLGRRTAV